jgi:hypothetical protein
MLKNNATTFLNTCKESCNIGLTVDTFLLIVPAFEPMRTTLLAELLQLQQLANVANCLGHTLDVCLFASWMCRHNSLIARSILRTGLQITAPLQ